MVNFYLYLGAIDIVVLSLALYFALISYLPTFDLRKVLERKSIALILGYFGIIFGGLLMIFWYVIIQELLLVFSSARCVVELMNKSPGLSLTAVILKIISFPVIIFVFSYRHIDVDLKGLPFLNHRVNTVILGSVFLIAEKIVERLFFRNVLAYLDVYERGIFKVHAGLRLGPFNFEFWAAGILYFVISAGVLWALIQLIKWSDENKYEEHLKKIIILKAAVSFASLFYIGSFLVMLNDELCPFILDLPAHTCLFCVLQYSFDMPVMLLLNLIGFGFLASLAFLPSRAIAPNINVPQRNQFIFADKTQGVLKGAIVVVGLGFIFFVLRVVAGLIG